MTEAVSMIGALDSWPAMIARRAAINIVDLFILVKSSRNKRWGRCRRMTPREIGLISGKVHLEHKLGKLAYYRNPSATTLNSVYPRAIACNFGTQCAAKTPGKLICYGPTQTHIDLIIVEIGTEIDLTDPAPDHDFDLDFDFDLEPAAP